MSIGVVLRRAREDMGATLEDVEKEIKIRRKYIIAMEEDDFDVLPGHVYVRGFLRNYARFLGIDGEALVNQYNELFALPEREQAAREPFADQPAQSVVWRRGLTVVAALIIVGLALYWSGVLDRNLRNQTANEGLNQGPAKSLGEKLPGIKGGRSGNQNPVPGPEDERDNKEDAGAEVQGVDMVLKVTDRECWMRVVVDNESVFEGTVGPNNIKKFAGRESIWVKLGDAGAVKVWANGKDYGYLGGPGDVVKRVFTANKGGNQAAGG